MKTPLTKKAIEERNRFIRKQEKAQALIEKGCMDNAVIKRVNAMLQEGLLYAIPIGGK